MLLKNSITDCITSSKLEIQSKNARKIIVNRINNNYKVKTAGNTIEK